MESDVHSDDRDTLYLSSCRVHLSGFETPEENRLVSMLFDGGATRFVEFNDTVTHLILGQPAESESGNIRRVMMWGGVEVVFPSWIVECSRQRQAVSTKEHLVSAEFFLRGQVRCVQRTIQNVTTCVERRDSTTPAEVVGSVQDPHQHSKLGFGSVILPGDGSSNNFDVSLRIEDSCSIGAVGKAGVEGGAEVGTEPQHRRKRLVARSATPSEPVGTCKSSSGVVFSGHVFGLLDPTPSQQRAEITNLIIQGGGSVEHDTSLNKLNFIVFSHRTRKQALEYHGSAQVVSDIWIRHCAKDGKLLDLRDHVLYRPFLRTLLPLPGFEKYLLCPSQLRDKERELAAELCMLLGGKFSEDLVTQVTHLILKVPEGDKFRGALKLGTVAIVSSDWLIACACKNMVVPVDEYRVGDGPSQKRSTSMLGVEIPESNASIALRPHSAGNLHGTPTITECGPSLPEMSDGQRAASKGKQAMSREIAASGTSELVTKEVSTGMKGTIVGSTDGLDQSAITPRKPSPNHKHDPMSTGKKKGGRSKQPQHGGPGGRATEGRLTQGPSQEHSNLDAWDSAAAPWAPLTAKSQQGKTFSESMNASALARDATVGAHQKSQSNTVHSTVASDHVENTIASPRRSVEDCAQPAAAGGESLKACGGESNKDSGESEAWAAVEGLLDKAEEAMQASKQTREADADAALHSPKRSHIQINQDDSESQLEFKRPKHNWHRPEAALLDRTRSSAGALGPSTSAHIHSNTQEHFEETQVESQVGYEDDLPGRQEILDKVRIRNLTVSTTRGPEGSLKDSFKERLCRIADGNR